MIYHTRTQYCSGSAEVIPHAADLRPVIAYFGGAQQLSKGVHAPQESLKKGIFSHFMISASKHPNDLLFSAWPLKLFPHFEPVLDPYNIYSAERL